MKCLFVCHENDHFLKTCLSICLFVTFYAHFLKLCVTKMGTFQEGISLTPKFEEQDPIKAECWRREGALRSPQNHPLELYPGPKIPGRCWPSDDDDDYECIFRPPVSGSHRNSERSPHLTQDLPPQTHVIAAWQSSPI